MNAAAATRGGRQAAEIKGVGSFVEPECCLGFSDAEVRFNWFNFNRSQLVQVFKQ
jgi:hypothetical protein